jgi:outer membrane lipoprotein LolB
LIVSRPAGRGLAQHPAGGHTARAGPLGRFRFLRRGQGWAAAISVALAGCASQPPASDGLVLTASGRLSVRVEASPARPSQSLSAAFEWRGDGVRGELTLLSPLGTQLALARWSPGMAKLITPEGETDFDTLDALAERALGERVPLAAWPDWLAGRPWPGAAAVPAQTAVVAGTPAAGAGFEQLGWVVDLSRHAEGRIEARRGRPPMVTVRIVLDNEARGAGGRP